MTTSISARAGLWIYSSQKRSSHLVSRSNAELCCMASLRYTRDALTSASPSFTPSAYPVPSRRIFLYLSYPSPSRTFLRLSLFFNSFEIFLVKVAPGAPQILLVCTNLLKCRLLLSRKRCGWCYNASLPCRSVGRSGAWWSVRRAVTSRRSSSSVVARSAELGVLIAHRRVQAAKIAAICLRVERASKRRYACEASVAAIRTKTALCGCRQAEVV